MKTKLIFLLMMILCLSPASAKSIVINGETYKNFKVVLFNKYADYFEVALQINKKITTKRARAFILYFYIPKKLLLNGEDKNVPLLPLDLNDNRLKNGCGTKIVIEDKDEIRYFFGDMDSTSIGTSAFNVKGYMQIGELGSGTIDISNIQIENQDAADYYISFDSVINLDLTATRFKRRIHSGTASICKRTDTKFFDEQTTTYAVDFDAKIKQYVYVIEDSN